MVAIALLRKGFPQVKVPRNDAPGFPNRIPLLQAVSTPVKFMRLSKLDLLLQPLVIPVLTAFGKLKQYGGFLGFGMPLQLGKHFEQLPKFKLFVLNEFARCWSSSYVQSRPPCRVQQKERFGDGVLGGSPRAGIAGHSQACS